jgi:hypothetical protein
MQKRQANPKLPSKSLILIGSRQGDRREAYLQLGIGQMLFFLLQDDDRHSFGLPRARQS